jgi:hypothetical protein
VNLFKRRENVDFARQSQFVFIPVVQHPTLFFLNTRAADVGKIADACRA